MKNSLNDAYAKWHELGEVAHDEFGSALYYFIKSIINRDFKPWRQYLEDGIGESAHEVLKDINKFDPTKGDFPSWVYVITRHTCIDMLRRRGDRNEQTLTGSEPIEDYKIDKFVLYSLVEKLSEEDQDLIALKVEGLTDELIAEKIGLAVQTVKNRFTQIRARLRTLGGGGN